MEAGVTLLAEGVEDELAPAVAAVDDAIAAVAVAQASLQTRITESIEGAFAPARPPVSRPPARPCCEPSGGGEWGEWGVARSVFRHAGW
jgi:hypothetical protein